MIDWLKKRLSPVKRDTPRWMQLAEAMQEFWEENFDPDLDRMKRAKSIYTADPVDLQREIGELGDFFQALPKAEDLAIAVAWRKLELLFKDTEFIITSTFSRKFLGLDVVWMPLWAKKTDAYGDAFYPEDEVPDFSDYYLTSRGRLKADIDEMTARGISIDDFVAHVDARMDTIKPLHIIYEKVVYDRTRTNPLYLGVGQFFSTTYTIQPPMPDINQNMTNYFGGAVRLGSTITVSQGA